MGVTGTFATLSQAEKDVLGGYGIHDYTLVPSVYGNHQLTFEANNEKYDHRAYTCHFVSLPLSTLNLLLSAAIRVAIA